MTDDEYMKTLSNADQEALQGMSETERSQVLAGMREDAQQLKQADAAVAAPTVFKQLPSFHIDSTEYICILCGAPGSAFTRSKFSLMCPSPCGLYVATADDADAIGTNGKPRAPLSCEVCTTTIPPRHTYSSRKITDKVSAYTHADPDDCNPPGADSGNCTKCPATDVDLFVFTTDGAEQCVQCFDRKRVTVLRAAQATCVEKRARYNKRNNTVATVTPTTSPTKPPAPSTFAAAAKPAAAKTAAAKTAAAKTAAKNTDTNTTRAAKKPKT
ncbi:unnamed protein product [Ectocarpus sp. 12 AP-2014]